jgi:hypothetical protein
METVPVEEPPATTAAGLRPRLVGLGAVAVSTPFTVPPAVAVTNVSTSFGKAEVFAANVAVVAPATTVTEAGTDTTVADVLRETTVPPVGAGPLKVTVPVDEPPPATELGAKTTLSGTGVAVSDSATLGVDPP